MHFHLGFRIRLEGCQLLQSYKNLHLQTCGKSPGAPVADSKSPRKDRGEQPTPAAAASREHGHSLYFPLTLFLHSAFVSCARSAATVCRRRRRRHAIATKFIGAISHGAPAGSRVSRQRERENSYSLQVHIIVAVIFLEHREGNDQSKGVGERRRHAHPYAEKGTVCAETKKKRKKEMTGLWHR